MIPYFFMVILLVMKKNPLSSILPCLCLQITQSLILVLPTSSFAWKNTVNSNPLLHHHLSMKHYPMNQNSRYSVSLLSRKHYLRKLPHPISFIHHYHSSNHLSLSSLNTSHSHDQSIHHEGKHQITNNNNNQNHNKVTQSTSSKSWYYQKLQSPETIMAPMVSQSDLPFRQLCRQYNTQLCYTQMIHSYNFVTCGRSFQDIQLDVYKENNSQNVFITKSGWNALEQYDSINSNFGTLEEGTSSTLPAIASTSSTLSDLNNRVYHENGPLIVQLAGHDPNIITQAAEIMIERTHHHHHHQHNHSPQQKGNSHQCYNGPIYGFDLNCGCPQSIARKGRYGAFLMEGIRDNDENGHENGLEQVCNILSTLKKNVCEEHKLGVSVKIRIPDYCSGGSADVEYDDDALNGGVTDNNLLYGVNVKKGNDILKERVMRLIDAGVDLITIHGRTLKENKTKVRECNWDAIALAVQTAREYSGISDFPVVANGGIEFPSDIIKCKEYTNANAIMSSEGLLENPGIFMPNTLDDTHESIHPSDIFSRQIKYCKEYLNWCIKYPPLPGSLGTQSGSFNCIRAHLFKMLYRYLEEHSDLRTLLGHSNKTTCIYDAYRIIQQLERRYQHLSDDAWYSLNSSNLLKSSWYRRHRESIGLIRTRGQKMSLVRSDATTSIVQDLNKLSVEERKLAAKKRIQELKEKQAKRLSVL